MVHPNIVAERNARTERALLEALTELAPEEAEEVSKVLRYAGGTAGPTKEPLIAHNRHSEALRVLAVTVLDQSKRIEALEASLADAGKTTSKEKKAS